MKLAIFVLLVAVASTTTSALSFVKPRSNLNPSLTSDTDLKRREDLTRALDALTSSMQPRFEELEVVLAKTLVCISGKSPVAFAILTEMYNELTPDVFLYTIAYNYLVNYTQVCNDCVNEFLPPGPGGAPPSTCDWLALLSAGVATFEDMVTHPNIPAEKADLYRMNGMIGFASGVTCLNELGYHPRF